MSGPAGLYPDDPGGEPERLAEPAVHAAQGTRRRRALIAGGATVAAVAVAGAVLAATALGPRGGTAAAGATSPVTTSVAPSATAVASSPAAAASAPPPSSATPTAAAPAAAPAPPPAPAAGPDPNVTIPAGGGPHSAVLPEGWQRYANASAGVSFDLPVTWRVVEKRVDGATPSVVLDVLDGTGSPVANLTYANGGLGGACVADQVPVVTLDSAPLDIPSSVKDESRPPLVAYRVLDATGIGGSVVGAMGLQQDSATEAAESCMLYTTMQAPRAMLSFATRLQINATDQPGPGTSLVFTSVDEALAFTETDAYAELFQMFASLSLDQD